jgi:hypothetical protein
MLATLKKQPMRASIPLKAELLDLVYDSADDGGQQADAESLGFNDNRLHADIYMNELLVSSRLIHQVLPKILEKLEIKFTVDDSELRLMSPEDKGAHRSSVHRRNPEPALAEDPVTPGRGEPESVGTDAGRADQGSAIMRRQRYSPRGLR